MTTAPYPISGIPEIQSSSGGGIEVFDSPDALAINRARMDHLASLELPLAGRTVLDVGCGVGRLAQFFVERGCKVVCLDGRESNIISLRSRYPGLEAHVANVESDDLQRFGPFEIVFCYGLLYHLENVLAGLRNFTSVCQDLLLVETVVTDHSEPIARLEDEPRETVNQTLGRFGIRPSPAFLVMALNRLGFPFIYAPKIPPDHADFRFDWRNQLKCSRDAVLMRCVFVASRRELSNPTLSFLGTETNVAPSQRLRELAGVVGEIQIADERSEIEPGPPARIITPEGRWSYGGSIPLAIPGDVTGGTWVRVRAAVFRGEAGFGLLNRDGTGFQTRKFVSAGPEIRTFYLQVADTTDLQSLIIQNATPDGKNAEVLLHELTVCTEDS